MAGSLAMAEAHELSGQPVDIASVCRRWLEPLRLCPPASTWLNPPYANSSRREHRGDSTRESHRRKTIHRTPAVRLEHPDATTNPEGCVAPPPATAAYSVLASGEPQSRRVPPALQPGCRARLLEHPAALERFRMTDRDGLPPASRQHRAGPRTRP